ncbi:hypothetical protein BUALT_Bualt01G0016900 [Buddleja alternifolia]|uniref:Dof zinc finger protein n=1 Tax=Buddleja alternifolia TaxID=168488 RepID=A0AAV6YCD3_9LAMI|nr:hypothetical protein BUALT_Bualt01G0016900 [Buddleja alternifolia]
MFTSSTTTNELYPIFEYPPIRPILVKDTTKLPPNCPRCASSNTKFCYYNNYTFSQPRYFCKACRRHWTKGGALRNVPVGGGHRKSRPSKDARQGGATNHPGLAPSLVHVGTTIESDQNDVFARYLNQNIENNCSINFRVDCTPSSQIEEIAMLECRKPFDLINGADDDDQLQQVLDQLLMDEDINGQDFVYNNCDDIEVQGVIGNGLASDILWSGGTDLPNSGSQRSTVLMQDFDQIFSPDDQLRISANVVENWGSFDVSGSEIFTRL